MKAKIEYWDFDKNENHEERFDLTAERNLQAFILHVNNLTGVNEFHITILNQNEKTKTKS